MQYGTKLGYKPINKPWFARQTQVYWYLHLKYKEKQKLLFLPASCRFPRGFLMIIYSMRFGLRRQSKPFFISAKTKFYRFFSCCRSAHSYGSSRELSSGFADFGQIFDILKRETSVLLRETILIQSSHFLYQRGQTCCELYAVFA